LTYVAQYLISLCIRYLSSEIEISLFINRYQIYFEDYQERLTESEFGILDKIYMACEFYESEPAIRECDRYLLDESQVREIISGKLMDLKSAPDV